MENWFRDLRYSLRALIRQPGFTGLAVLTLALGIGANTAIFSVVNSVLLSPLPYREADRLMEVTVSLKEMPFYAATPPKFHFWREQSQSFEAMTAQGYTTRANLASEGEPELVETVKISRDFLGVFAVQPAHGRGFTVEEDSFAPAGSGAKVALLTDSIWQRRFAGNPGIVGTSISLNNDPYTVVGVLPKGFRLMTSAEVLTPLQAQGGVPSEDHNYSVIARLKPGVSEEQARSELRVIAEAYRAAYPKLMRDEETVSIRPYKESFVGDLRPALLILLGAVSFVLLIACANVANLQLVRATARQREMAVRTALGAGWLRLTRQLITEGLLLSLAGGLAGLILALWGVDFLTTFIPPTLLPVSNQISFSAPVLLFTLVTSLVTGLLFALAPALQVRRVDINRALKENTSRGGSGRGRLRNTLVITEIALSLVLLIGAALLIRTFVNLQRVDSGFDSTNVLTFKVQPSGQKYATSAQTSEFHRRVLDRLGGMPGVEAVAVTSNLPLDQPFRMNVWSAATRQSLGTVQFRTISPDYFRVMRMAVKQGREFTDMDKPGTEPVVIVNEAFAGKYLAETGALGQQITHLRPPADAGKINARQIVGVVADLKQFSLRDEPTPMIFLPSAQVDDDLQRILRRFMPTTFALRTTVEPMSLAEAARQAVLEEDPQIAVASVRSMEQILDRSISTERFYMLLLAVFAAIGLLLAGIGIYGAMSFVVAQRTQEIGIRMALGARAQDVLRMVLRQGLSLAVIGIVLGVSGAVAVTRLMKNLLFGVEAVDVATFGAVTVVILGASLLACFVPARRATKVDPLVALKYE